MKIKKSQLKELIRQSIIEASDDVKKAKEMGLKSKGFGNWVDPKTGEHYSSKGGKLHKVDTPTDKGDTGGDKVEGSLTPEDMELLRDMFEQKDDK